jgi:hypothetical protein
MKREDSPSVENLSSGQPAPARLSGTRITILILVGLVLVLVVVGLIKNGTGAQLAGTGKITGTVLDNRGQPATAVVMIFGRPQEKSLDANGNFELDNVPAGNQVLVVTSPAGWKDIPVSITPGTTLNLGEIRLITTLEPPTK